MGLERRQEPTYLLHVLVCPVDKGALERAGEQLVCTVCGRHFTIVDGIPNMLVEPDV